jgi:hypothetical protein
VVVPVLVGFVYWLLNVVTSGSILLATVPAGTRESFFVSLSATAGALLGFAITGLTILLSLGGGPRMDWLKANPIFRLEARRLFITAIAGLGLATVVFLLLVVVATSETSFPTLWGCIATATIALVVERIWRLVDFFNRLMKIALKDVDSGRLPNPPMKGPVDD